MILDSPIRIVLERHVWVSHQMGSSSLNIFIALHGSLPVLMDKLKMKNGNILFYFIFVCFGNSWVSNGLLKKKVWIE